MSQAHLELFIPLERGGDQSLTSQLLTYFRTAVHSGALAADARLPASRRLAADLGVSRSLVTEVYDALIAEGYLVSRSRSGTFIARESRLARPHAEDSASSVKVDKPSEALKAVIDPPTPLGLKEFRVCEPDPRLFPLPSWTACLKRAVREPPGGYGSVAGDLALREEIVSHLRQVRGVCCDAEDVVVTSGAAQAISLAARACLRPGDSVAFENPGYRLARHIFSSLGTSILSVPVDADGLRVAELRALSKQPRLTYVTPSHQFPTGERLSLSRRLDLLRWAGEHHAFVLEDDYDSEFRFGAEPLPALASLDTGGRVIYVGTFSKTLSPSLRLGYLVAPPELQMTLMQLKLAADYHSPLLLQKALALFMQEGHYAKHVRRMRRVYARRRELLADMLSDLDNTKLRGLEAGLHAFLELRGVDAATVKASCREKGVIVKDVQDYAIGKVQQSGLVLGYASSSAEELTANLNALRASILG